jgi:hypothetical protein
LSDTLQELARDRDAFRGQAAGTAARGGGEQDRESP